VFIVSVLSATILNPNDKPHSNLRCEIKISHEGEELNQESDFWPTHDYLISRGSHRQKYRIGVRLALFILPKDRLDAKLALLLNEAANVMAEQFAKDFIHHREVPPWR